MATYTEVKAGLDEIAQRTQQNAQRVAQARSQLAAAQGDLAAMPGAYGSLVTEINAGGTANPDNPAWQTAVAEKDELVSDFQALKAEVDALVTAVNP